MNDKLIHLSSDALFQEVGGEAVILDLATARYFGLDTVGARFWQLLQDSASLNRARDKLIEEFDVDAAQLEADLDSLVEQLMQAGLVSVR